MGHIKFTARPRTPIVSSRVGSMALNEAPKISIEQRETTTE
jgi:hypothetical protein